IFCSKSTLLVGRNNAMRIGHAPDGAGLRCNSGVNNDSFPTSLEVSIPSRASILRERASISEKLRSDALAENRSALVKQLKEWGVRHDQAESNVPRNVPPNMDIVANMREARSMTAREFVDAVKSGGKWDFKRYGRSEYEDFGNWHFGVMIRSWTVDARERG